MELTAFCQTVNNFESLLTVFLAYHQSLRQWYFYQMVRLSGKCSRFVGLKDRCSSSKASSAYSISSKSRTWIRPLSTTRGNIAGRTSLWRRVLVKRNDYCKKCWAAGLRIPLFGPVINSTWNQCPSLSIKGINTVLPLTWWETSKSLTILTVSLSSR